MSRPTLATLKAEGARQGAIFREAKLQDRRGMCYEWRAPPGEQWSSEKHSVVLDPGDSMSAALAEMRRGLKPCEPACRCHLIKLSRDELVATLERARARRDAAGAQLAAAKREVEAAEQELATLQSQALGLAVQPEWYALLRASLTPERAPGARKDRP